MKQTIAPDAFPENTNAVKRLDEAVKAKARFLDQLVNEELAGIDNLVMALKAHVKRYACLSPEQVKEFDEELAGLRKQYENLQDEHNAAGLQVEQLPK